MSEFTSLKNHFLIAMPTLRDPNFFHSVTYICEHTEEGAMGIVINHPLNIILRDVLLHLDMDAFQPTQGDQPIFCGGPLQRDRGFVIHEPDDGNWQSSLNITEEIAITTSKDILEAIALDRGPQHSVIALGFAGWDAGKLEQELADNVWLSCPASPGVLFHTPNEDQWRAAAGLLGIDIAQLSHLVGHS